jgi:hypothetical protein
MKLLFSNNEAIDFHIDDSPLGLMYQKIYKNLSKVPIPWRPWDNPCYKENLTYSEMVDHLVHYAQNLSIDIDTAKCINRDQDYFNSIHKIYEDNYNGNPVWLDFHEHIHLCEYYNYPPKEFLCIDYREKSGLLEKPMDPIWLLNTTTKICAGDIYVRWAELGKTPYHYWENNEPNDLQRMCQLAKPWLKLRPNIHIALKDIDTLKDIQCNNFATWWKTYQTGWTAHWNISKWTIDDIFGVSVFGKTTQTALLKKQLRNNLIPTKITL